MTKKLLPICAGVICLALIALFTYRAMAGGKAVASGPLTLEETKAYLDTFDAAKASSEAAEPYNRATSENFGAWTSTTQQLNEAHQLPKEQTWQIAQRNCRTVFGKSVCDRTVIKAPPQPKPDDKKPDDKTKDKEPAKK